MTEPQSPLRVFVTDHMEIDGVAITMGLRFDAEHAKVMRFVPDGYSSFEDVEPAAVVNPTLRLSNDFARALLDALLRHYQGASDMHTVRADLLHERGRVDRLLEALIGIASRPQPIQLRRAEG